MHYEKEHIKNELQTAPLTELGFNTAAALLSRSHEGDHLPEAPGSACFSSLNSARPL